MLSYLLLPPPGSEVEFALLPEPVKENSLLDQKPQSVKDYIKYSVYTLKNSDLKKERSRVSRYKKFSKMNKKRKKLTLTPESEIPGTLFSGTVSMMSFLLRGLEFEEGCLGGRGLLIFPDFEPKEGDADDPVLSSKALGSAGGAFSLNDFCFRSDLCFCKLGFGDDELVSDV